MPRNPRRAYDSEGREFEPLSLANMREHGVRSVVAECRDCKREALVNVDSLPDGLPVPESRLRSVPVVPDVTSTCLGWRRWLVTTGCLSVAPGLCIASAAATT